MYGGEVTLQFESLMHKYTLAGKSIPSVTTIISATEPKPALLYWAANMASDWWKEHITPGKGYDEIQLETIWKEAKKAHTIKKEDAASIGSLTHKFVEDYVNGKKPGLPYNEISKGACERFMDWVKENKVQFLSSEQPIYSRKWGYCGTADFFCVIDGKLYLGDLKTSNALYDSYSEQVFAYQQARKEEYPTEMFSGCVIVRVGKEDSSFETKFITQEEGVKYLDTFNCRVELYKALQKSKTPNKYDR